MRDRTTERGLMSRTTRIRVVVVALVAVLALGACSSGGGDGDKATGDDAKETDGGGADEASDDGEINACELVTKADAEAVMGFEPHHPEDVADANPYVVGSCVWEANPTETSFILLQTDVYDGEQYYGGELFKEGDETFTELDGIGDKAFATGPAEFAGSSQVQFVVDGRTVILAISGIGISDTGVRTADEVRDRLIELARTVAERTG